MVLCISLVLEHWLFVQANCDFFYFGVIIFYREILFTIEYYLQHIYFAKTQMFLGLFLVKIEKAKFKILYGEQWIERDDTVTRYVDGNKIGML